MEIIELKNCLDNIDENQLNDFRKIIESYDDILILGNGGSNAIAQHIAQDYTKVLNKKALCFADASRLTCYINDYGPDNAYVEFIKDFANSNSLVILISSSGKSRNIINCVNYCEKHKINIVTLSGMDLDNELNMKGQEHGLISFHVHSYDYGVIEITHEAILHSVC